MRIKLLYSCLLALLILCAYGCTTEPTPPNINGYISLDKTIVELPDTPILGYSASTSTVKVSNVGEGDLLFKFDTSDSEVNFNYSTTCKWILKSGEFCSVTFRFVPNKVGNFNNVFKVVNLANGSEALIALSAKGIVNNFTPTDIPNIMINTDSVKFPMQAVSSRSSERDIEITNIMPTPVQLNYVFNSNNAFIMKSTCVNGGVLLALEKCKLSVSFAPTKSNVYLGGLKIAVGTTEVNIPISGEADIEETYPQQTGIVGLMIDTNTLNFYETDIDNNSHTNFLRLFNDTANNIEVTYTQPDNDAFSIRYLGTSCVYNDVAKTFAIAPGKSCIVNIEFKPKQTIQYTATMNLMFLNRTISLTLKGRGQNVSSGAIFGYVIPTTFADDNRLYKNAVFLNNTPFAIKTGKVELISYNGDGTVQPADASVFNLVDNSSCADKIIGAYQSCAMEVEFYVDISGGIPPLQAYKGEILILSAYDNLTPSGNLTVSGSISSSAVSSFTVYNISSTQPASLMTSSATIGQKVYFYGGIFDNASKASLLTVYDFSDNSSRVLLPSGVDMVRSTGEARQGYLSSANMVAYEGKIIVYGGKLRVNYTNAILDPNKDSDEALFSSIDIGDVFVYDPNDRVFSQDGSWKIIKATDNGFIPTMMLGSASAIYKNKIYFFGGINYNNTPLDINKRFKTFDLITGEWQDITAKITNITDDIKSRVFSGATVLGDALYIYGGTTAVDKFVDYNKDVYILDFTKATESTVGELYTYSNSINISGDNSTCLYTDNVTVSEAGPCKPYRLRMVSIGDKIYTTSGMVSISGSEISGPWGLTPNLASATAIWKNYQTLLGLPPTFNNFELLTSIDGVLTAIGNKKLYLMYVN